MKPILYPPWLKSVLLILFGALCGFGLATYFSDVPMSGLIRQGPPSTDPVQGFTREYQVAFANAELNNLVFEKQTHILTQGDIREHVNLLWQAMKAPLKGGSVPLVPKSLDAPAVFIDGDGVLYLDFDSANLESVSLTPAWEILLVTALKKTLVSNLDNVLKVKLLVDHNDAITLAGATTIQHPLSP